MTDYRIYPQRGSQESRSIQRQKIQAQMAKMAQQRLQQTITKKSFIHWIEEGFNPVRRFLRLEEHRKGYKTKTEKEKEVKEELVEDIHSIQDTAARFQKQNAEMRSQTLLLLRNAILTSDSVEDILKKVLSFYPDLSLADEALDFLLATTKDDIKAKIQIAKERLNNEYSREIQAGKNIHFQARIFSKQGLGSPTALRDMYRDITGNKRTPLILFHQLSESYSYEKLKSIIRFLLHSLGTDLKSKGPSIDSVELMRLMEETRNLQAILGVYRFFKLRMKLIHSLFSQYALSYPMQLGFELLAKTFIGLLQERYLSAEKVFQIGRRLGLSEELIAQMIIFMQMRDAIRQISPRLYKNQQQKDDLIAAFLEALEEIEEELEEKEEKEEEDK